MDGGQAMLDNLQKLALNADQSRRPKEAASRPRDVGLKFEDAGGGY